MDVMSTIVKVLFSLTNMAGVAEPARCKGQASMVATILASIGEWRCFGIGG